MVACGMGLQLRTTLFLTCIMVLPTLGLAKPSERVKSNTMRQTMDFERMEKIFREVADEHEVKAQPGYWEFLFRGVPIVCISDKTHNRMRLVSPIMKEAELTDAQKDNLLRANFHTALDARYAAGNGVLWSAFIHPLGSLTNDDLKSAIRQVATLVATFGTSYSSGELLFPGGASSESEADDVPQNGSKKTKI